MLIYVLLIKRKNIRFINTSYYLKRFNSLCIYLHAINPETTNKLEFEAMKDSKTI